MNLRFSTLQARLATLFTCVLLFLASYQTAHAQIAASCVPGGYVYAVNGVEMYLSPIVINSTTYTFTQSGPYSAGAGATNTNATITGLPGGTVTINTLPYLTYYYGSGSCVQCYGGYWMCSVDWNNNGTWETGETMITNTTSITGGGASFVIPSTVTAGPKRMRICACYSTNAYLSSPCDTYTYYRDFKDFTLNVGYNNDCALNTVSTSTAPPFAPGTNNIVANITNNGLNTVTSVVVNYTITPSTGAPITGQATYTGSLANGASTNVVIASNYNFPAVGSASVSASIATVNGVSDGNSANNNGSALLGAGLNGTYTVGGSSPDFTSISQAASQLTAGGTIGAVTLNIRPGTYTENVYLANIPGNSTTKPIVFQSENGNKNSVVLQYTNAAAAAITGTTSIGGTPTLRLNNADYVTFRNFTIAALSTTANYGNAIELIGATGGTSGCDKVTFDNMVFNGVASSTTSLGDVFFLSVNNGYHPNLTVTNCTFNQSAIPFYHTFAGTTYPAGDVITNNTFNNYGYYAMRLEGTDGATVNGNTWTTSAATAAVGVIFVNHNGGFNFRKNRVNMTVNTTFTGVTSGSRSNASQAVFANNFVRAVSTTAANGISCSSTSNVGVFHNTVYASTTGAAFTSAAITTVSTTNNIFINANVSGVAMIAVTGLSSNYNDIWAAGVNQARWNGTNYPFATFKSVSGLDANSANINVPFVDVANNNLSLLTVNTALYGIGSTSNGTFNSGIKGTVGDDIFGTSRLTRSEIFMGAHQLVPLISFNPAPPANLTGCADQTLIISANAVVTAGAQLSFSWQRNGAPLLDGVNGVSGASTNTLTITNAQPSLNGGDYVLRVTATGGADPLVSDIISVVVNAPIVINQQPSPRIICQGNETSLAVVASGTILGYQWQKDGVNITGATSPILVIANAGFQMSGKYRVVMTGTCGTTTVNSEDAAIVVASNTLIGTHPETNGAAIGSTGYLTVEVNATAQPNGYTPTFQWYQGTNMLQDNGRISGATTSQMTIRNMQTADITQDYYCVVTGICGSQSSTKGGFYVSQISIQNQPQSQEVCSASDASLMVTASSNIPNVQYSYQWKLNGVNIANSAKYQGTTTSVLTIKGATTTEAGDYTCLVTAKPTGANLLSQAGTITVISAPVISTQPASATACAGEKVTMSVAASGGTVSYQWKASGVNIPGATDSSVEVITDASMNGKLVSCVITNNCGTTTSSEATLTVNDKPSITTQPSDAVVVANGSVTLTVTASGATGYQWKFKSAAIPGANSASLVLNSFTQNMAGEYVCDVTNSCGTVSSNAAVLTLSSREEDALAAGFNLSSVEPTPTTSEAVLRFTMPTSAAARIVMHDSYGRQVAVLFDGIANENTNVVPVDASQMVSGVYTYTLSSGQYSITRKMVVSK